MRVRETETITESFFSKLLHAVVTLTTETEDMTSKWGSFDDLIKLLLVHSDCCSSVTTCHIPAISFMSHNWCTLWHKTRGVIKRTLWKQSVWTPGSCVTVPTADVRCALKRHLSSPASSRWPPKSSPLSPSISAVVIPTAKCRHHCRNKLTPFHRVRVQPSEKPTCPPRQIETDSERKRCSGVRETEGRKRQA